MIVVLTVLAYLVLVVTALCLVAGVAIVGPSRLYQLRREAIPKFREIKRQVAILGMVLVASALFRSGLRTVSELYGLYMTGVIFAIEGEFVAWLQTFARPELTVYFSWIYIYGYVFMLVFPIIAYGALREVTTLKRLLTAYALNYAIGLVVYTVVFAHGPRNVMPDMVTSLLYTHNPDFQMLTREVNENTNVFPSLHTALAATVAIFGYLTRGEYPTWAVISAWLALSVMTSTMYLGIHWAIDVVAGVVLAAACVHLSYRYVTPSPNDDRPEAAKTPPTADDD